jgi:membrane protease YdiL (CAAX protease family)
LGCLFEGGLAVLAVGLAAIGRQPLLADLQPDLVAALTGLAASAPLMAGFVWSAQSSWRPLVEIRVRLEQRFKPIIVDWSIGQLALISALAGLGEELLFRGVLQGRLELLLGQLLGWVAASLAFGLAHPVTRGYVVAAVLIGLYLGGLWQVTDNLLVPIVAHSAYDFLALLYFVRLRDTRRP